MLIEDRIVAFGFQEDTELKNLFHQEENIYVLSPDIWIGFCRKNGKVYLYEDKNSVKTFEDRDVLNLSYKESYENENIFTDYVRFTLKSGGVITVSGEGLRWKKC